MLVYKLLNRFVWTNILFSLGTYVMAANLSIVPMGQVIYQREASDSGALLYEFKVSNLIPASTAQGLALRGWSLNSGNLSGITLQSTNCPFNSATSYLQPSGQSGDSCVVIYKSSIPKSKGNFIQTFSIVDGLGGKSISSKFGVNVKQNIKVFSAIYTRGIDNRVNRCPIDQATGNIEGQNCMLVSGSLPTHIMDIHFNSNATKVWIAMIYGSSPCYKCDFDVVTHNISNCSNAANEYPAFYRASSLLFNSDKTVVWASNFSGINGLMKCNVDVITGDFKNCTNILTELGSTRGDLINKKQTKVYITQAHKIVVCDFDHSTNDISNCIDSGATNINDGQDKLIMNKFETKAWISNYSGNNVTVCNVNSTTGLLSGCVNSGATELSLPSGMELSFDQTKAWISNNGSTIITQCNVDTTTGLLSGCHNAGAINMLTAEDLSIRHTFD